MNSMRPTKRAEFDHLIPVLINPQILSKVLQCIYLIICPRYCRPSSSSPSPCWAWSHWSSPPGSCLASCSYLASPSSTLTALFVSFPSLLFIIFFIFILIPLILSLRPSLPVFISIPSSFPQSTPLKIYRSPSSGNHHLLELPSVSFYSSRSSLSSKVRSFL